MVIATLTEPVQLLAGSGPHPQTDEFIRSRACRGQIRTLTRQRTALKRSTQKRRRTLSSGAPPFLVSDNAFRQILLLQLPASAQCLVKADDIKGQRGLTAGQHVFGAELCALGIQYIQEAVGTRLEALQRNLR